MNYFVLLFTILVSARALTQDSLAVDYPLFVYFHAQAAYSGNTDSTMSTGFYMSVDTTDLSRIEEHYLGAGLLLINNTGSAVVLPSVDGNVYIVAEAWIDERWQPITAVRSEPCASGYYPVTVDSRSWRRIETPVFKGPLQTRLRYVLYQGKNRFRVSNEVTAHIHPGQADFRRMNSNDRQTIALPLPYPSLATATVLASRFLNSLFPGFYPATVYTLFSSSRAVEYFIRGGSDWDWFPQK